MPRRLIAATAVAAGMSVVLLGCTGGPARTVTGSAPVAGPAARSPGGASRRAGQVPGAAGHDGRRPGMPGDDRPPDARHRVTGRVGRAALTFVTFVIKGHCDFGAAPIRCVAGRVR